MSDTMKNSKLDKLITIAIQSAEYRKHRLNRWVSVEYSAYARCVFCDMQVTVDANPPPNGIDISGQAVALNCPEAILEVQ